MKAAEKLLKLTKEDIRILMGVEQGMRKFKMVPANHVAFFARYKKEETQYHLDKVHKMGLLQRDKEFVKGDNASYKLIAEGYDILALHALYQKNVISSIGPPLGKGKESDVYRCLTPDENEVALKFFRIGRTSFRNVKKFRSYVKDKGHINWLYINRLSATQEYEALKKIHKLKLNVNVPVPYAHNRHTIVMNIIQGDEIYKFPFLNNPEDHFNEIIKQYKEIYAKANIVHGDLGEFNVLVDPDDNILIIDWPQWAEWTHVSADQLLKRDIHNICSFFEKKHKVISNPHKIIHEFLAIKNKSINTESIQNKSKN
ncbi:MAG: hypothetical protein GF364_22430 [Candidatus Lokiarchaeota archaeon]|nr:hypothetical protein [Candidatus Lokiarchaeota archaeon]